MRDKNANKPNFISALKDPFQARGFLVYQYLENFSCDSFIVSRLLLTWSSLQLGPIGGEIMLSKIYIIERVTERDSVIAFIDSSILECIHFMKKDRSFPRDTIWCWSLTIAYSEQAISQPRVFFDWDGKLLFRKDENTIHATEVFREKEFLPIKAKLRARR